MAEGLDFVLDLDAKTQGVKDGSKVLSEIMAKLKETGNESDKTAKKMDMSFRGIVGFELVRRAVSGTIDLVGHLGREIAHVGAEMLNVAAQNERTGKSFELLFGSTEGRDTLEWIEGIAKFTEFTDDQLKGMAGSLAKVGFEGEALTRALAASLDMAAFSGSGEEGASAALSSLERIKRTGRIDNRSLGGLGIGEKAFLAELSRRTGEGAATLKKKIDEGKLDAETSLEALYSMIAKKTGKDLGGAGVLMGATFQARLKHLKDLPDQFFQKLSGSQGFAKISEFTGKLVDALDPDSASGKKIMGALTDAFDAVGSMVERIDLDKIFGKGLAVIEAIPAAISAVTETLGDMATALKPIVDAFKAVAGFVDRIGPKQSKKDIATEAELANPELFAKQRQLKHEQALEAIARKSGFDVGGSSKAFGPPDPAPWFDAGQGIGKKLEAGTRDALDLHSPSRVFEDIGAMTGAGFNRGISKRMASDTVARGAFAMPVSGGSAGGRGPIQVTIDVGGVHLSGHGGDGAQLAQQVADHLRHLLPGELQSAFERVGNQAGVG